MRRGSRRGSPVSSRPPPASSRSFGLLALLCFPGAFRPVTVGDPARAAALALIGRTLVVGLALVVAATLAGLSYVRPHHLFFLILAPVWLIGRLDRAALRPWAAPAFAAALALLCLAAAVALPIETRRDAADCDACEEFQPVGDLRARAAGRRASTRGTDPRAVATAGLSDRGARHALPRRAAGRRRLHGLRAAARRGAGRLSDRLERGRRLARGLGAGRRRCRGSGCRCRRRRRSGR